jgi:3-hydroxymyristoyl/3-hydroxydecanoyl-(acyl carrier protein) dehydratase
MIKSILPQIISQHKDGQSHHWRLFVAADLPFFDGHFTEQAVLPGVSQLDWAIKLGCQAFNYPASAATLEVLKFQQLILPNTYVDLNIEHQAAKGKLIFAYSNNENRYASGRILLRAPEAKA